MYLQKNNVNVVGVDIFITQKEMPVIEGAIANLQLRVISNRGTKIWPNENVRFELCDLFRCRFTAKDGSVTTSVKQDDIVQLLSELSKRGFEFVHIEKLLEMNGKASFSEIAGSG